MSVSSSLARSLSAFFSAPTYRVYSGPSRWSPAAYENSIFNRMFVVKISNTKEFFIPCLDVKSIVDTIIKSENTSFDITIPIYSSMYTTKRTADSILNTICNCPTLSPVAKVTTSKGLIYYGGNGLIFDKDWKPLCIGGYKAQVIEGEIHMLSKVCYIHPEVFISNDILEKAIIKKLIPFLTMHDTPRGLLSDSKATIIVKDCSNMISTAIPPINNSTLNSDIWDILDKEKDSIACQPMITLENG